MLKIYLNKYGSLKVCAYTVTWVPSTRASWKGPHWLSLHVESCFPAHQHPDPLLPLGQTQSSGLHGLQIRYAAPQPLSALWRVSASSTLRRATPHPWTMAGQILLCATMCQQRADFLQGLRPRAPG